MTTFYDMDDLERHNNHLVGELKDAKSILKEYLQDDDAISGEKCQCDTCTRARAWLARNKQT